MILAAIALAALTTIHFPVSTADAQAQAIFDRGLFFYYAFNGGDAAAAFADAATRDPALAMAYWGEALADGPDLNTQMTPEHFDRAQAAIRRAVALENDATPREHTYIDAMALRYKGTFADLDRDETAYRAAMLQAAGTLREADAQLLAAEALLEDAGYAWKDAELENPDARRALELVNAVLARDPNSVMANHLCVHLYDQAPDREPALPCAQRLDAMSFPRQAEHLAHMPAHYWIETGNYAAALASSERAYALFTQLEQTPGHDASHDSYLGHDLYVAYSAAMMLGNYATGRVWSARMDAWSAAVSTGAATYEAITALRFNRDREAYAFTSAKSASLQYEGLAVHGYAALRLGRAAEAHRIADRLRQLGGAGYFTDLFYARLAEAEGKYDEAHRWIDLATAEQRNAYSAELLPLFPAPDALGGLLLRRGAYEDAVAAFDAALKTYPNDPRALFGLATALAAAGRGDEAAQVRTRFEATWTGADTELTLLGL